MSSMVRAWSLRWCWAGLASYLCSGCRLYRGTLPLGLPWLGAHFRIDALAAFFLVVVNLGGAAASLFALGYGRHEHAPNACCRSTRPSWPA